jgi:hypothetical protein
MALGRFASRLMSVHYERVAILCATDPSNSRAHLVHSGLVAVLIGLATMAAAKDLVLVGFEDS